jgi:hypothetical protein
MFSVIFEAHPRPDQWDAYLGHARMFRPEFEQIEGFVDNIRYRSLTREGWILSLSGWRDETETGDATTIILIDAGRPAEWVEETRPEDVARWLGLAPDASSPRTCSTPF